FAVARRTCRTRPFLPFSLVVATCAIAAESAPCLDDPGDSCGYRNCILMKHSSRPPSWHADNAVVYWSPLRCAKDNLYAGGALCPAAPTLRRCETHIRTSHAGTVCDVPIARGGLRPRRRVRGSDHPVGADPYGRRGEC